MWRPWPHRLGRNRIADTPINSHFNDPPIPAAPDPYPQGSHQCHRPCLCRHVGSGSPAALHASSPECHERQRHVQHPGPEQQSPGFARKSDGNANFFREAFCTVVAPWKARQIQVTPEVFSAFLLHALLHERTHFLINALPAGSVTQGYEEGLESITFEKYADLLSGSCS